MIKTRGLVLLALSACLLVPVLAENAYVAVTQVNKITGDPILINDTVSFEALVNASVNTSDVKTIGWVWGTITHGTNNENFSFSQNTDKWAGSFSNTSDAGEYSLTVYVNTTDGNQTNSSPLAFIVRRELANTSNAAEVKALFSFTNDIFDTIAVKKDSTVPAAVIEGIEYMITFSNSQYNVTLPIAFNGSVIPIKSATSPSISESSTPFISKIYKTFQFHYENESKSATICFNPSLHTESNKTVAIIAHCKGEDVSSCDSDTSHWSSPSFVGDDFCVAYGTDSFFILGDCKTDNFCKGNCHKDSSECVDKPSDTSSTSKKKTEPEVEENHPDYTSEEDDGLKIIRANETEKAEAQEKAEASGLTGAAIDLFGLKIDPQLGIAIGVLVAFGCAGVYFAYKHHISKGMHKIDLGVDKGDKDKKGKKDMSIHELVNNHKVSKPGNSDKLKAFLEVALDLGHDPSDLKLALKYRGWDMNNVKRALDEVMKNRRNKILEPEED